MADAQFVNVVDSCNQLLEMLAGFCLFEPLALNNQVEEFPTRGELHNQVQIALGLDDFVDLNDVGVVEFFKNFDFPGYSFHIFLIFDLRLFKHFHSHLRINKKSLPFLQ